jgi:hypothetical protein
LFERYGVRKTIHPAAKVLWYSHDGLKPNLTALPRTWEDFGEQLVPIEMLTEVADLVERLQEARVDADYYPAVPFTEEDAKNIWRDAETIAQILGPLAEGLK